MTRRDFILVGVAAGLIAVYGIFFAGWFKRSAIAIRQAPPRLAKADQAVHRAAFDLMVKYPLKSVKVAPLQDGKFNKFTPPVWSLVSKSNSIPTKAVIYGSPIDGMTEQTKPVALKPGVTYRLVVEADGKTGELDFTPKAVDHEPTEGQTE